MRFTGNLAAIFIRFSCHHGESGGTQNPGLCGPESSKKLDTVGLWTEEPHSEGCFYLVRFAVHLRHNDFIAL